MPTGTVLPLVVSIRALRVLGIGFVLLHAAQQLPAPFAPVAGWRAIPAGVLAFPDARLAVLAAAHRSAILGRNVVGAVDLVAAISLALMSLSGPVRVFTDPLTSRGRRGGTIQLPAN